MSITDDDVKDTLLYFNRLNVPIEDIIEETAGIFVPKLEMILERS